MKTRALGVRALDRALQEGPFREAMLRDQQYLLDLDLDRLLHGFRLNAGLPPSATPFEGRKVREAHNGWFSFGPQAPFGCCMLAPGNGCKHRGEEA